MVSLVYDQLAVNCPPIQVASALMDPALSGQASTTWPQAVLGEAGGAQSFGFKFNSHAVRGDLTGRYGGGGTGVAAGLVPSATGTATDLDITFTDGFAMIDGPVGFIQSPDYKTTVSDNILRGYVWLTQAGAVVVKNNDPTPPAGPLACFLCSFSSQAGGVAAGTITVLGMAGRVELRGGYLWRRVADAGTPGDTPPAVVAITTQTAGGTYFWDGLGYRQYLNDSEVTAAKLDSTLRTGFISLPLTGMRVVASNDVPNSGTADGGLISKDTDPVLERNNAATDKRLRLKWVATSVVEVILGSFAYPPDLDDAQAVTVKLLAKMAGATDTPTIAVSYFEGTGDTNAGGNTAALSATEGAASRAIAAGDVGPYPTSATVGLTPGAHGTDALYVYAAWVEYVRK